MAQNEVMLDVVLGNPDGQDSNTLLIGGVDLEIPLEMDLEKDPLHDDEVRLLSEGGGYDRVLRAGGPEVRFAEEKGLYLYRFPAVPPGVYRLLIRIVDGGWTTVCGGIVVGKKGVRIGELELDGKEPDALPARTSKEETAPAPPASQMLPGKEDGGDAEFMDAAENVGGDDE